MKKRPIVTPRFSKIYQELTCLLLRAKYHILKRDLEIDSISYIDHLASKGGVVEIQWNVRNCYKIEVFNGKSYPGNCKGISIPMDENPIAIVFKGIDNKSFTKTIHINEDPTVLIDKFQYQSKVKNIRQPLKEVSQLTHGLSQKLSNANSTTLFRTIKSVKDWSIISDLHPLICTTNKSLDRKLHLDRGKIQPIYSSIGELISVNHPPFDINQYTSES